MKYFLGFLLLILSIIIISCASTDKISDTPTKELPKPVTETVPAPIPEFKSEEKKASEKTDGTPISPKKNDIIKTEDQSTEISQEQYAKTFEEVEKVIDELNSIIKAGDFNRWTTYLTPKFIQEIMDPNALEKINEQPVLKRNKIIIKTLSDYFIYVVVPSRASVRLDDLIFTDPERVRAFMLIRGDRVLIYQLEKITGKWKISTW